MLEVCRWLTIEKQRLENVFVKHYAPNHMPDPKGEWSLIEKKSELHYGIRSKVNQFIYTLVCSYMPFIRPGGAKVLGKLSVPGRPTYLDYRRERAYCAYGMCG